MALIDLPLTPGPARVSPTPMDFGGQLPGLLGGPTTRLNRQGNRWAMVVAMRALTLEQARAWSADLTLGMQFGVRWKLRQVGLMQGPVGTPRVNGAGQEGYSLICDGFLNAASWKKGTFINLISGGNRYVHKLAAAGYADAGGNATLQFTEKLRVFPADNDLIDFAPYIEGLLDEGAAALTIDERRLCQPFSFTIAEQE